MKKKHKLNEKGKRWFPLSISFWCNGEIGPFEEGCADEIFVQARNLESAIARAERWLHRVGVRPYDDQEGSHEVRVELFDRRCREGFPEKFLQMEDVFGNPTGRERGFETRFGQYSDRVFLSFAPGCPRGLIPFEMRYVTKDERQYFKRYL